MISSAGHVFVSHSSDNRELANELAAFLEGRGVRIWIAPRDVRPGMDYSEQLQLAIEKAVAFVVLVTDMANKSPYVRAETEMAFSTHKPIFPVRIGDTQPAAGLALFLKIRHWTDAYGPRKSANLDQLASELQALSGASAEPPAQSEPAPPPPPAGPVPAPPAPPALPAADEDEEKWRAAIGPNADYYLERWRQMDAKGTAINWNWAACLANLFWFAYRKMWLPMVALIVASLLLSLLGAASPQMAEPSLLLSIGLTFVTGSFGNHLYRRQTARLVAETAGLDRQAALDQLRSRGGISIPALVISLSVFALLILISLLAAAVAVQQNRLDPLNQTNAQVGPYGTDSSQPVVDGQAAEPVDGDKPVEQETEAQPDYYPEDY